MNKNCERFAHVAPLGMLIVAATLPAAYAAESSEPSVADLTKQKSTVEVGAGWVSDDSYKFGEYNGLQNQGAYFLGNFDLRGGSVYDSGDVKRWSIVGTNIGLENRNIIAEFGLQSKFNANLEYDELRRNRSDTYQTPYQGAGMNRLTLPTNWITPIVPVLSATAANALVAGVLTAPSATQLATSNTLIATDVPDFNSFNLHTKRTRIGGGLSYLFGPGWDVKVSARHEDKDGTKPMGTVTRTTGADISTVIPDLIDQTTDQFNLNANFHRSKEFLQFAYYGSLFKNNVNSMTWTNWANPTANMTMSSAPSNQFHQFSLSGGYNFSAYTHLVANGAYGRSTQNQMFIVDNSMPLVPHTSLDGLVVTETFNVKLSSRPIPKLNLNLSYKYDDRDNKTPVASYAYYDANEAPAAANADSAFIAAVGLPAAALKSNININANRAYSKTLNEIQATADYHLTSRQSLKGGFEWEKIDRTCRGSWIDCADAASTTENTLRAEWRAQLLDSVDAHIDYAYSQRRVDQYDENAFLALVPMANISPSTATGGASAYSFMTANGLVGYGPVLGFPTVPLTGNQQLFFPNNNALANALYANVNRISELIGMRRFNMADRDRNKVRTAVDWQATDRVAFQAGVDYNKDDYSNSVYGLTGARNWAFNLDGSYELYERLSISGYYTHEDMKSESAGNTYTANSNTASVNGFTALSGSGGCNSFTTLLQRNLNNKIDPCLNWATDMQDKADTLGVAVKKQGFISSKIDLRGNADYTRTRTTNDVRGGSYANNPLAVVGAPVGTVAAFFIPATPLPEVSSDTIAVRISAKYAINDDSSVRFGYAYQHLTVADYAYDGMQYGGLVGVLPSNEKVPNYTVHVVGMSYTRTFR
jgi:MtrB/PioB family decaheme-associated outer membrane protein